MFVELKLQASSECEVEFEAGITYIHEHYKKAMLLHSSQYDDGIFFKVNIILTNTGDFLGVYKCLKRNFYKSL